MSSSPTTRRMRHIPPDLRGAARAICDVDPTQFPELYERPSRPPRLYMGTSSDCPASASSSLGPRGGAPSTAALQKLMTEVNDGVPLTAHEFRLFHAAYAECREHLRGVPAELMGSGTPLSAVLALTSRIDALCTELGVTLTATFPQLKETHLYVLHLADDLVTSPRTSDRLATRSAPSTSAAGAAGGFPSAMQSLGGGGEHLLLQNMMLSFLAKILERGVQALLDGRDAQTQGSCGQPYPRPEASPLPRAVGEGKNSPALASLERRWGAGDAASNGGTGLRGPQRRAAAMASCGASPRPPILCGGLSGAAVMAAGNGVSEGRRRVSITLPTTLDSPAFAPTPPCRDGEASLLLAHDEVSDSEENRSQDTATAASVATLPAKPRTGRSPAVSHLTGNSAGHLDTDEDRSEGDTSAEEPSWLFRNDHHRHSETSSALAAAEATATSATSAPSWTGDERRSDPPASSSRRSGADGVPATVAVALSSVNADLRSHLAHLRWLVDITHSSDLAFFSADDHLADASMGKMWGAYIGSNRPACTREVFDASGLITLFPAWLHGPMMAVLDFKNCGVVSLFTVQRLLEVWGPLLLLDRNLQDDVRSGILCLREPSLFLEETLAHRPDAQAGDFAVALTETPGEIRLVVLRHASLGAGRQGHPLVSSSLALSGQAPLGFGRRGIRSGTALAGNEALLRAMSGAGPHGMAVASEYSANTLPSRMSRHRSRWMSNASYYCDDRRQAHYLRPYDGTMGSLSTGAGEGFGSPFMSTSMPVGVAAAAPLRAVSYRLTQETGAWSVQGLTKEEFESIAEACRAFPDVFRRARGDAWAEAEGTEGSEGGGAASGTTRVASASFGYGARGRISDSFSRLQQQQQQQQLQQGGGGAANSALHRACFRNNARYVRTLLLRGAGTVVNTAVTDPAVNEVFCWTPLLCAANNPNGDPHEIVAQLLAAGADVDYKDDADCTALYYAIANGYAATATLLLAHKPTLSTSPETVPLMVALGAHPYLPCERDIRRLTDVVPSAAMLTAVTAHVDDYRLCSLALRILLAKLNGGDITEDADSLRASGSSGSFSEDAGIGMPSSGAAPSLTGALRCDPVVLRTVVMPHCPAGPDFTELHTPEEDAVLARLMVYHNTLCHTYAHATRRAMAVLCARCYLLSWREWLALPPAPPSPPSPAALAHVGEAVGGDAQDDVNKKNDSEPIFLSA